MEWDNSAHADDKTNAAAATDECVARQVEGDRNGQVPVI
jgi:hypothetical protein